MITILLIALLVVIIAISVYLNYEISKGNKEFFKGIEEV